MTGGMSYATLNQEPRNLRQNTAPEFPTLAKFPVYPKRTQGFPGNVAGFGKGVVEAGYFGGSWINPKPQTHNPTPENMVGLSLPFKF